MKHTKGPWTFHENGDGSYSILEKEIDTKRLRWVIGFWQNGEFHKEEQLANMKLITAAPDLLGACLMAREELIFGGDWKNAQKIIDEAVKKATE
jgi:hypothetical protein